MSHETPDETIARLSKALEQRKLADGRTWLDVARWAAVVDTVPLASVLLAPWQVVDDAAATRARARLFHELHRLDVKPLTIALVFRQGSARLIQNEVDAHARRLAGAAAPAGGRPQDLAPPTTSDRPASPEYLAMFGPKCRRCKMGGHKTADCPEGRAAA